MTKQIWCDASYDAKRKVAGFGIVIKDRGVKTRNISNWIPAPSINYAEMFAIYQAAILAGCNGVIYTDSQTALSYLYGSIKDKPRTREQYIQHQQMRVLAYKIRKLGVHVEKVKAHQRIYQESALCNNMADLMAKYGRSKFYERGINNV